MAYSLSAAAAAAGVGDDDWVLLLTPWTVCHSLVAEQAGLDPQNVWS